MTFIRDRDTVLNNIFGEYMKIKNIILTFFLLPLTACGLSETQHGIALDHAFNISLHKECTLKHSYNTSKQHTFYIYSCKESTFSKIKVYVFEGVVENIYPEKK